MGGTQSLPSTTDMPTVLNFIFQEMFRRVDLADIYSLADPERCKRYVIVATNALESLFVKMRINPNKKDGTLYFQSIDGIMKSMPADIRAKQREYCVELAFFFIRIFQIFGALFLSMYDSRLPLTDPSTDVGAESPAKGVAFLNPKDFLGFSNPPQASNSWFGSGGDLFTKSGDSVTEYMFTEGTPYYLLNYYLKKPTSGFSRSPLSDFRTPMRFDTDSPFLIPQLELYDNDSTRKPKENLLPRITYWYERDSNSYEVTAQLKIELLGPNIYKVSLINFESEKLNKTFENKTSEPGIFGTIDATGIPKIRDNNTYTRGATLPTVLKIMFDKVLISVLGEPPFSAAKYLKKIGYIKGENDKDQVITGSSVYLLRNQENDNPVKVTYQTKIKFQGADKLTTIEIRNVRMTIVKVADSSVQMSFRVSLDYSLCDVKPPEYRSMVTIPTTNNMTFRANSEDVKPTSDANNLTIPEWLESVFKKITSSTYQDGVKGLKITRAGLVEPYDSAGIRDELKVKKLWAAMAKDPPVKSHCVARAVQLLSLDALKGNFKAPAYSSICRLTFGYQKDGSLPTPAKPVIEESGIYALSLLFFEGLERGAPKILNPVEYKQYLQYLKYLFEHYPRIDMVKDIPTVPGAVPNPDAIPSRLSDIRERLPKMCADRTDTRITLPESLARNLKSVTNNLFAQQAAHYKEALTLIFSLFDQNSVEREKKLKFNPKIIAGGMNEINSIAANTRQLLLKYYKGCELTYRDGLLMIYNYEKNSGKLPSMTVDDIKSGVTPTTTEPTVTRALNNNVRLANNNNNAPA
jgi:hypothetical protein